MRSHLVSFALAGLIASSGGAFAQALLCPPSSSSTSQTCEIFHYHVAMYRLDTRLFAELDAVNQFSSQPACERAREAAIARNLAVVDAMKRIRNENQYEPDRIGPCHCDATIDRASSNYRSDAQRLQQLRNAEDIRRRVRERLLDAKLTSDSELIRGLSPFTPAPASLGGPKLVQVPQVSSSAAVATAPSDLKLPKPTDSSAATTSSIDLPLVDVVPPGTAVPAAVAASAAPASASPAPAPQPALPTEVVEPPPAPLPAAGAETPAAEPQAETPPPTPAPAPAPAPAPGPAPVAAAEVMPDTPAEDVAEAFVAYETQRIDKVLQASDAIADDNIKSRILEACTQRIQLLSNLRTLIQGSGMRSRLATAAMAAHSETERLALVAKLFGSDMPQHWAPKDAADVVLDAKPELEADPERALRDTTGRVSDQQKRRALYLLLAHSQPTEDQQLWLTTVIDRFLQGS